MPTENNALSDEISRRRTQSATYTTPSNNNIGIPPDWRKDNSPRSHADWSRFGNELRSSYGNSGNGCSNSGGSGGNSSSPISIQHLNTQIRSTNISTTTQSRPLQPASQPAGSIGSAILSGVFSTQNNQAGEPAARSQPDDGAQKEVQYLRKKIYEYEQCYNQVNFFYQNLNFQLNSYVG